LDILPYLVTMVEDNSQYLPEAFLYLIDPSDTDYRATLLSEQESSKWWSASGDKYYDTALALYPLHTKNLMKKQKPRWYQEQEDSGCWNSGNILDTAFILHSIFPKTTGGGSTTSSCSDLGYYCMSSADCNDSGGTKLDYSCSSYYVCCDTEKIEQTCEEAGGKFVQEEKNAQEPH